MKTLLLVAGAAMGAIVVSGCAAHETTTTTTAANPPHRTYNGSELKQTGQPDAASTIGATDPSAQIAR